MEKVERFELEPLLVATIVVAKLARGVAVETVIAAHGSLAIRAGARAFRLRVSGPAGDHERQSLADGESDPDFASAKHAFSEANTPKGPIRCDVWIR
jgi:ribosomal protein S3